MEKYLIFVTYAQSDLHKVAFYQPIQVLCNMVLGTPVKFVENPFRQTEI